MDRVWGWVDSAQGLFWTAIAVGVLLAAWGGWDLASSRYVIANGVEATAQIDGATRKHGRSGDSYTVNLVWRGAGGEHRADGVSVTEGFILPLIDGKTIESKSLRIKYVPNAGFPFSAPVVVDDLDSMEEADSYLLDGGAGLIAAGGIGCLLGLVSARRRKKPVAPSQAR